MTAKEKLVEIITHCSFHNPEILADRILAELPKLCEVDFDKTLKIMKKFSPEYESRTDFIYVAIQAITQADVIKLKE